MMTEKRTQQLIAKALASAHIDRAKYYHMCWWEGRLRCLRVHHTKDVHPVFFAAPGEVFAEPLNRHQWQLLTDRIAAFCRSHNVAPEEIPCDVVTMNSPVHLKDRNHEDRQRSISLVFPADAATDAGLETAKVPVLTPIGLAILGRRVGDHGEGHIRIQDLPYQPEAAGRFDP